MHKLAIISDIHGNGLALDAVLEDLAPFTPDRIVCLGDALQGGPQPDYVAARLRSLACPVVLGNADDYLLTGADSGAEAISPERRERMEAVREWQRARLSAEDVAFTRSFLPVIEVPLDGGQRLICFHGSPRSYDDVITPLTPDEEVRAFLEPQPDTFYTGGHTHVQFVRHFGRTFHFNPGSVGFAYRHDQPEERFRADPWAEYALLSVSAAGRLSLEFRRVPFDVERLRDIYLSSGRPFAEIGIAEYSA